MAIELVKTCAETHCRRRPVVQVDGVMYCRPCGTAAMLRKSRARRAARGQGPTEEQMTDGHPS
jgi:hypothetical protein